MKALGLFALAALTSLANVLVLTFLWNTFACSLGAPPVQLWAAYGLALLANTLRPTSIAEAKARVNIPQKEAAEHAAARIVQSAVVWGLGSIAAWGAGL